MVIVVDDADRENEGDLIMAAEKVTAGGGEFHGEVRAGIDLRADHGRTAQSSWASRKWFRATARASKRISK